MRMHNTHMYIRACAHNYAHTYTTYIHIHIYMRAHAYAHTQHKHSITHTYKRFIGIHGKTKEEMYSIYICKKKIKNRGGKRADRVNKN